MAKEIILAENAGFCFGVKRAVETAIKTEEENDAKVYTLGPLIHNNDVVSFLKNKGITPIEMNDNIKNGDIIIIRSHGVPFDTIKALNEKEATIVDATCPFVSLIHKKVKKYYEQGYAILVVGDSSHPEVIGINGWCDNNAIISKDGSDIVTLSSKICVVSQTTEKQENWQKVLSVVTKQCKEIIAFNTICSATEKRQKSAFEISKSVDVMFVIGSKSSSNTNKLFEICKDNCESTFLIENSDEIPVWITKNQNIKIGITAGASTPDWIIKEAINKMSEENTIEYSEQLTYMEKFDKRIKVGEIVKGEIISINEKEAFLNIGYKAEGLLPIQEVTFQNDIKLSDILSIGEIVETKIISIRNEDGYVVLSRIEIKREEGRKYIKEAFEENKTVDVLIKEEVKGGVVGNYNGIRIFIPASHLELAHVDNLKNYVGKTYPVNIIEYSEGKRNSRIVGSRRNLLKAAQDEIESKTWEKLEKDIVVDGEVKRLTDFGAFVDVDGVDGLLHVSELSWGRVNKPSDVIKIGEKLKVKIIDIDKENKKLSLSIKALSEDPWANVDERYPVNNIVLGKVVRFADFGAFIELEPGIDALVHISEISHKRINKPSDELIIGQQVKAKILDVNKEAKKIGLSIKAVE
ncbi:bifunctional 4-hydroxy-3-methylbut-2-enyl diphosphate reductase/30S ribosomal protein S1 [Clostridium sp. 19966]|uniref:bifunctional 4-hydroxy-3-methylbut-2-enyl diphosphate reductase/30S ribosomal protein S1 n=1 Tax=Clostridium sp. 19966 TaxID=2768166 RepID=UPI0028DEA1E1|nr:bifunctional 4-hydroxy-3-methylbut-2-enyl diphosphate reductase/30S ribosomal protein S1 [Clostridium sp. 19966]MDT8716385.1 bifunctional 4-hydroxy-3-methylbut-2-enyl diphosphate reductase/30S ribosomal protein S1 [Clostridium sp. 19966]